jgi:hypothetical protein
VTAAAAAARLARGLRVGGALLIAVVAVMRTAIFFAPQIVFDVDPAFDPEPLGGLGPAGSLVLDVVLIVACACALVGEALAGRGVSGRLLVAAVLPMPVVLWHGAGDAGDLWRGATWGAAALAAVAVAHLARDAGLRRLLVTLLAAGLGVLIVRGIANVTYEHDENVALFEMRKADILRDKGWAEGSPFAQIFERRVRQRQPGAWFVTTNIFASFMAFGVIAGLGLTIASARARLPGGWSGGLGLVTLAAAGGLWMTGSKGGQLAAAGGVVLLVAPLVSARAAALVTRFGPAIMVAFVLAALGGVVLRGVALPEGFAGEKSLLFRWHYTVSSTGIIADHPVVGVGPDGYQPAYMLHRVPRNPEEVASAHSVFWDWLCALGIAGAAWIALVGVLVARSGRAWRDAEDGAAPPGPSARSTPWGTLAAAGVVAAAGLLPAIVVETPRLHELDVAVRLLGVAAFLGLAAMIAHVLARVEPRLVAWSLACAATATVVHGQIEMTLTQPGAVVWVMAMLALAARPGTVGVAARWGGRAFAWPAAALAAAGAVWLTVAGVVPAVRQERLMLTAAERLRPLSEQERPDPALVARLRRAAADDLVAAWEAMPTALGPRLAAGEQLEKAARFTDGEGRIECLEQALAHGAAGLERGDLGRAAVLALFARRMLARLEAEHDPARAAEHARAAVEVARAMTEADPHGLHAWLRYADTRWEVGLRDDEARDAYRRTLEIDAAYELDPLKRLPDAERARVETRLAE